MDTQDATAAAPTNTAQPAGLSAESAAPLGSWAARQTVMPLPARPTGFPAQHTKVRSGFKLTATQHLIIVISGTSLQMITAAW